MPAASISIRKAEKFVIPNGLTPIVKANVPLGSIEKTNKTLSIEHVTFEHFKGAYTKDIIDDITVFDTNIDDYVEFQSYKKKFSFNLFYSKEQQILFSDATTPITKKFLKELSQSDNVELKYNAIHFDLEKISSMMPQTKGVRFSTVDPGVSKKNFSGDEVDTNLEAIDALRNDDAVQLIGTLDVGKVARTVMLTQSGTLLTFSSLADLSSKEYPMLEFALATLRKINYLK